MKRCLTVFGAVAAFALYGVLPQPTVQWNMTSVDAAGCVPDETGGGNALALGEGCSLVTDDLFGRAVMFDGLNHAWAQASAATSFSDKRSVAFWIRREADDGASGNAMNTPIYLISNFSGSTVVYRFNRTDYRVNPCAGKTYEVGGLSAARNAWQHLVFTLEQTGDSEVTLVVYVNGVKTDSYVYASTTLGASSKCLLIGNADVDGERPICGRLAKMRFYDDVLTDAEARDVYLADLSAKRLIGHWPMEAIGEDGGVRTVASCGTCENPLTIGADAAVVSGFDFGSAIDFPNKLATLATTTTKYPLPAFSFGVWLKFGDDLEAIASDPVSGSSECNTIPHLVAFGKYLRLCVDGNYREPDRNGIHVFDAATLDNGKDGGYYVAGIPQGKGAWMHLGVTYEIVPGDDGNTAQAVFYRDGEPFYSGRCQTAANLPVGMPAGTAINVGNNGASSPRSFAGQMHDLTVFAGKLSDAEMASLARGLPSVSAGEDFTVARAGANLNGSLGLVGSHGNSTSAVPDSVSWSLVSAPAGGTGAAIATPADMRTAVTLPVAGDYVFRLTAKTAFGLERSDDVTVTRTASGSSSAPVVVASASSAAVSASDRVLLTATVTDADTAAAGIRVKWRKVSGADAVRFDPAEGTATCASFFGTGTYGIAAIADDGANATTSAVVTVTVSSDDGISLDSGLIAYWPFDASLREKQTDTAYSVDLNAITWEAGVDGYAVRARGAFYPCVDTGVTLLETADETLADTGADRFRAFSCWIYHDSADTNDSYSAVIVAVPYSLGLWYNCENGVRGFTMYQQTSANQTWCSDKGTDVYPRPAVDPLDRWTHVYALFDRRTKQPDSLSALWIDGVKQTPTSQHMGGGRMHSNTIEIGGHMNTGKSGNNGHFKIDDVTRSRTFPGRIDEVRMYNRALSEAEIKFLAERKVVGVTPAPAVDGEPDGLSGTARSAKTLSACANVEVGACTYAWRVVGGEAANLVIADPTQRETAVTALKKGTYRLQLAVTANGRTTYSEPIAFTAAAAGMSIVIR